MKERKFFGSHFLALIDGFFLSKSASSLSIDIQVFSDMRRMRNDTNMYDIHASVDSPIRVEVGVECPSSTPACLEQHPPTPFVSIPTVRLEHLGISGLAY